jgi:phage nucleotide-binding protein
MKVPYKVGSKAPYFRALIYGDPGVGKTVLAGSATQHPDLAPVLFLNVDRGADSLRGLDVEAIDIGGREAGATPVSVDAEEIIWSIIRRTPPYDRYKTVVVDNLTEWQGQDLIDIVDSRKNKNRPKDEVARDDYGKATNRLLRSLRLLRDAPVHLIMLAWKKVVQPEGHDTPTDVLPNITQQAGVVAQGLTSCCWHMYIDDADKRTRKLLTQPTGVFRAKTRIPGFAESIGQIYKLGDMKGPHMQEPNLKTLYNMMLTSGEPKKEK